MNLLPIHEFAERTKLLERLEQNDVTILIGETGTGKSSQLPQLILDKLKKRVLCAQPRRIAASSIAKRIASERRIKCGKGEVGYHIGNEKVGDESTQILFCTTAMLWQKIRMIGSKVFRNRDYIIIDEVHEKDIHTDLTLTMLKHYMQEQPQAKLVLMSATADSHRYAQYFEEFETSVITIDKISCNVSKHTIIEHYYEECLHFAGYKASKISEMIASYKLPHNRLSTEIAIVADCVKKLDKLEKSDDASDILVFLPRFRDIIEMRKKLKRKLKKYEIIVLHSSLDVTLDKINKEKSRKGTVQQKNRVYLATNIAESSLTIPDVAFIFDMCHTNNIYWSDNGRKTYSKMDLESKSQAKQRRGRTGRTCSGHVYYLMPKQIFNENTEDSNVPELQCVSLRDETLMLICSQDEGLHKATRILRRSMHPPKLERITDALAYLNHIDAVKDVNHRTLLTRSIQDSSISFGNQVFKSTFYGNTLSCLPFELDNAETVLRFACEGLLLDGLLVAAITEAGNQPIVMSVDDEEQKKIEENKTKFSGLNTKALNFELISQVAAFVFWRDNYQNKCRFKKCIEMMTEKPADLESLSSNRSVMSSYRNNDDMYDDDKEEWCEKHGLSFNAMKHIDENVSHASNLLLKVIIEFLMNNRNPKQYLQEMKASRDLDSIEEQVSSDVSGITFRTSFSGSLLYSENGNAKLSNIAEFAETLGHVLSRGSAAISEAKQKKRTPNPCAHFQKGICRKGEACTYAHDLSTRAPDSPCLHFKFFKKCSRGDFCTFPHVTGKDFSSEPVYQKKGGNIAKGVTIAISGECVEKRSENIQIALLDHESFIKRILVGTLPGKERSVVKLMDIGERSARVAGKVTSSNAALKRYTEKEQMSIKIIHRFLLTIGSNSRQKHRKNERSRNNSGVETLKAEMEDKNIPFEFVVGPDVFAKCDAFETGNILIWWQVVNKNLSSEHMGNVFASALNQVFLHSKRGCFTNKLLDLEIVLTMDHNQFYRMKVLELASKALFELVEFRPAKSGSDDVREEDEEENRQWRTYEFHFMFKLNKNFDYKALFLGSLAERRLVT